MERGEDGAGVVRRVSLWAVTATNSWKPPPTPHGVASQQICPVCLCESERRPRSLVVLQYRTVMYGGYSGCDFDRPQHGLLCHIKSLYPASSASWFNLFI